MALQSLWPDKIPRVIEFSDYQCSFCKIAHRKIQNSDNRVFQSRLIVVELPILGPDSEVAARYALAAKAQGKYVAARHMLFNTQPLSVSNMERGLSDIGVNVIAARKIAYSSNVDMQLESAKKLAKSLGISATPAFISHEKIYRGWNESIFSIVLKHTS